MKRLALLALLVPSVAIAQPKPKIAKVEAEVILIGCTPLRIACGYLMNRQDMAIRITKVNAGPYKVGDSPVVAVMTCFDAPLLRRTDPKGPWVELDPSQIRRGSKISLEFEVYPTGTLATTDKIAVTKL